ncbi:bifunctional lysylphosphatidylglycerol synthetase/lysine--tRNA ligase LysX [Salininema proteolyticum]|uniref:Lysine--tRNA ligase n=1 Tax=Salininema proteolyticum TaxID=1607685 RepID=A0ABV8U296_9ACTN
MSPQTASLRPPTADEALVPPDEGFRAKIPAILSWLLVIVAGLSVLGSIARSLHRTTTTGHIQEWMDLILPAPPNLAYAALLIVFAAGVARRKRVAWWVLTVYFSLSMLLHGVNYLAIFAFPEEVVENGDTDVLYSVILPRAVVGGTITLVVLILLFAGYRQFYAKVERFSFWRAVGVFFGLGAVFVLIGRLLVRWFPGDLAPEDQLEFVVKKVVAGAFRLSAVNDGLVPGWITLLLGLFGAISIFAAVFTLLRSRRAHESLSSDDEVRIRALLAEYGQEDSLGYFATRRDKAAVFEPGGRAAITYRTVGTVCLASGDPVGDPAAWPRAIEAWVTYIRRYGWVPAALGASQDGAQAYADAGLKVLNIGDEAILHTKDFTLEGREMKPVRQAVNRIERAGYTFSAKRHRDLTEEEMSEAILKANTWRDTSTERGFSMALSRLGDVNDGDCVMVRARDAEGNLKALLSFVPWGKDGLSLDLMRRDRSADNGLTEYLVSMVAKEGPSLGIRRVSLNFAMFRAVFEEGARLGAGPVLRIWRRLLLIFSHWWQLESLYRSNVKYRPDWEPRYLVYGERRALGRVGVAAGIAEGFISPPARRTSIADGSLLAPLQGLDTALEAVAERERKSVTHEWPEQVLVRANKVGRLRTQGVDPYPVGFDRGPSLEKVRERWNGLEAGEESGETVSVAGRVMLLRHHGRLSFAQLRDWSGTLQLMVVDDPEFKRTVDVGDHLGVHGEVVRSRKGELSVRAEEWTLTAKCLRPLPDKWKGLTDPEARVRQRYLTYIMDDGARDLLRQRTATLNALRDELRRQDYLEVETPILQAIHGGANARPFQTHINAYDMDLYLRIAPELYLKRLCVGGVERVFELGRNFRNEGVSFKHNPEFTMLEAYQAYADYTTMRHLTERLIRGAAEAALGTTVLTKDGVEYDLADPWPVVPVFTAISDALGRDVGPGTQAEELRRICDEKDIPYDPKWGEGDLVLEMYERLVEHETLRPTFYTDFPASVSPLTREHRDDPRLAERWDLVAFGTEIGTAYSELVDPIEQRRRLTDQSLKAAGGDPEAMELDENFLEALEYAMPPSGGLGIGVDRLVMLLTDKGIRDTLPFPMVKPHG